MREERTGRRFPRLAVGVLLAAFDASVASAGNVLLVADKWDSIAYIQIREGNDADPNQKRLVYTGALRRGQQHRGTEGQDLCYRRSSDPANARSPVTRFRCVSHPGAGTMTVSID
jgi:hypothetical protein